MIAYTISHDSKIVYVGITKSPSVVTRWLIHLRAVKSGRSKSLLHHAIRNHGDASFVIEHVASAKSWADLCDLEGTLIEQHGTYWINGGFNMTLGGEGAYGAKRRPESIAKTRAAHIGRKYSLEVRARMRASKLGSKRSPEACAKTGAALRGRKRPAETVAKIAALLTGKRHSAETKLKIGDAARGRVWSPESRERASATHLGKPCSAETRAKISAGRKGWTPPPELRAAVSASNQRRSRSADGRLL